MDQSFLKQMYQHSPFGFAYQRVLFDRDDHPEDYVFLYVNPAFEELMGFTSKKLINQRVTKVLPGNRSGDFDWVRFYGEMVLQKKQKVFEHFSEPLNRWYKVHAYPVNSDCFCTLFMDITQEKGLNEDLERLIHVGHQYMTDASSHPQIQEIVDEVRELSQAKYAALNLYNDEGSRYHTVAISGGNKVFDKVSKILGFSIRGKEWEHDPIREKKMPKQVNVFPNLRALAGHSLSTAILTPIEKLGGIGQVVLVKIMQEQRMIGDFTLFMPAGKDFEKTKITQSYAHFFGLMLLRKDAEKERRKLAHDYEMVFQSTQAALFLVRVEGPSRFRYLRNNNTHQQATGIRLEDLQGKTPQELLGVEFGDRIAENYRQCLKAVEPYTYQETLDLPGGIRTWLTTLTPVWEGGSPSYIVGSSMDITEQKQMEEDLKESELRFSVAIDGTQAGIWDWDMIKNEVVFSSQWKRMLGYADDEIEDKFEGWKNLWHPDDIQAIEKAIDDHLNGKTEKYEIIHRCRHKDRSWRWIMTRGKILKDRAGKSYRWVGTNIDITKQKEIEQALKQAMEAAEAASKAKSEFLANMSHEIRTPLNSVIGFTDLLMKTQLTDIQKVYCENANASGKSLLGIINDILDFSKIEAGKLELEIVETDVAELLQQTADIIKYHAEEKGLELLVDIQPGIPRIARLDPVRMKQILTNLLSNAVKFTETGEVAIKLTFSPLENNRGTFHFSIRDTGIGIKEEQKEKLFKAFSQADSSTTRKFGGTGLGLIISNSLAEKMGDAIHLDSTWGKGSIFSFSVETEYQPKETYPQTNNHEISPVKSVMVLDNNASNREILSQYLEYMGITVSDEENPFSVLKILEKKTFDLLIVNYHMPYINGLESIHMIREKLGLSNKELPAIMLHTSSEEVYLKEGLAELGVKGCLVKPVKPEELYRLIMTTEEKNTEEEKNTSDEKWGISDKLTAPFDQPVILIVEDVSSNMILIKSMIGYLLPQAKMIEAENGKKALEILKSQQVNLVLMDVQMPVMDGIQATKQIRKWEVGKEGVKRLPIIALTAGALKEEQQKALDAGMDEFLTKPIEQEKLQKCFNVYLNGYQTPEQVNEGEVDHTDKHLDLSQMLKMVGGDKTLMKTLIQSTKEDIPNRIESLTQAIEERDSQEFEMAAHAIKGIASNLHFQRLADLAKAMEAQSKMGKFKELERLLSDLKGEWDKVLQALSKNIGD